MTPEPDINGPVEPESPAVPDEGGAGASAGGRTQTVESREEADESEPEVDPLVVLAGERDEYLDALQRTKAEFDNYRKRVERDRVQSAQRAGRDLLEQLLPVMDSLERAVETIAAVDEQLGSGLRAVRDQLAGVVRARGVEQVVTEEGGRFDPAEHEAVQSVPSAEHEPGTVMAVVQTGYRFGDGGILRPARVVVAAAPPAAEDDEQRAHESS